MRSGKLSRRQLGLACLILGPAILAVAAALTVFHLLYASPLSLPGASAVGMIGVVLTLVGPWVLRSGWRFTVYLFFMLGGFAAAAGIFRAGPWANPDATELSILAGSLCCMISGFLGLRSLRTGGWSA